MSYLTFGDIQRRARAAGLVMSRRGVAIHLRYRDERANPRTWSGLDAAQAAEVVAEIAGQGRHRDGRLD